MWKFLLICALAVCVQGRGAPMPSRSETNELLNELRALLKLRSDHSATNNPEASVETSNAAITKTIEDIIREKYGALFTTLASDIENGMTVSEPITYVIDQLYSQRSSIVPCMNVAQLIGAVRFAMVYDLQPGMYYTLRGALEKAMMETGHMINLDQSLFRNIGHAILKPVFDTLEQLECDIGIAADCPAPESAVLPRPSPMEQLFWDTKAYMDNVNFKNTDVGTVIAGFLEGVWVKLFNEKFPNTYTCEKGIEQAALDKLGKAIESLKVSTSNVELKKRLSSVISDVELVDRLADTVIQNHFVENYQAMQDLKQLIEESKTKGLQLATSTLNGFVLSSMYESTPYGLFDSVLKDVMSVIEADTLNKPLYDTSVEAMLKMSAVALQSIMDNWKTPCLNARLVGMLAGIIEVQKVEAMRSERVTGWYTDLVKEFGLSIVDTDAKAAFEKILDITLKQPFKPFVDHVLNVAGPQPTELTLFELYQALSRRPETATIRDGVHTFVATLVPLFRYDQGEHSAFKCEVSKDDFLGVLQQAYGIIDRLKNPGTMITEVKDVLSHLSSSVPQEKIEAFATTLINELKKEILNDVMSALALLEGVTKENAVDKLTTYLAVNLGYSIKYIVEQKNVMTTRSVPSVPKFPTNPTEFVAWQQKLVSDFVSQYMTGMAQYNMVSTNQIDICTAMPQICNVIPQLKIN